MTLRSRFLALSLAVAAVFASSLDAQQPETVVVAAANAATPTPGPVQTATAEKNSSLEEAMQTLEAMKAANAEVLAKQQATLQQLDELQSAANQIKIYAHRG